MSRNTEPLKRYYHRKLMDELNETMIVVKVWLFDLESLKQHSRKPTVQELDSLQARINQVLQKENELVRKI